MGKVRIIYREDGKVTIRTVSDKARLDGESDDDFYIRIFNAPARLKDLPYDDVDESEIPSDRKDRDKWRGSKGNGIHIDHLIITESEKRQAIEVEYDTELDKQNPDVIKVLKLKRKLDKRDY